GGVDTGRVVDEVGVEQHARLGGLDAAELGQTQIAALAHDPATQLAAVDAQTAVGAVTDVGMGFRGGLDVRTDATVPQQVDRRLQRGAYQFGRGHRLDPGIDAQHFTHLRGDLDRFQRARIDAAALADQLAVVIGPARTRHGEQARTFLERGPDVHGPAG